MRMTKYTEDQIRRFYEVYSFEFDQGTELTKKLKQSKVSLDEEELYSDFKVIVESIISKKPVISVQQTQTQFIEYEGGEEELPPADTIVTLMKDYILQPDVPKKRRMCHIL